MRSFRTSMWALAVCVAFGCNPSDDDASASDGVVAPQNVCLAHERLCVDGCVDVLADARHCGACGAACANGDACEAGVCRDVCGDGLGFCGGTCVSLESTAHCGACGSACAPGQFCYAGVCGAACPETVCPSATGSECVSLADDRMHCGACGNACPQGDVCVGGQCVLDCGGLAACDRACVDLTSDDAHCGACGAACAVGKVCVAGACACPDGLEPCGDACVDTLLDPEHCGGCDLACEAADLCEAGACVGPDGCVDTLVAGLGLSAVEVYQSIGITVMEDGLAVAAAQRNADVVQGREAVFRVYVEPTADWTPREVSARVTVQHAGAVDPEVFFAKGTPTVASKADDPTSTFQVKVPAEALGTDVQYAVSLVECGGNAPVGIGTGARFPADGLADLEARVTGLLKVHVLPLVTSSGTPEITAEALQPFESRLLAMYPITGIEMTIGAPLSSNGASMCDHLTAISSRRSQDDPPIDVYYYGLTLGTSGGQSGCATANLYGASSSSKVAAGWHTAGVMDDGTRGAATMCHEIGHSHGRLHAPCQVQDPDPNYPYPSADIGVWAYDRRSEEFLPPTRKDMMSYCPNPDRTLAWMSDYTYQALVDRVADVNALVAVAPEKPLVAALAPKVAWRMLVVDTLGARWSEHPLYVRGTPEGTLWTATIHGADGPMQQVAVYRVGLEDGLGHDASLWTVPEPSAGWVAIEVPGVLGPTAF